MGMRVVKAWKHTLKREVNFARTRGSQRQDLGVRAHSQKSPTPNGHRLSSRLGFIHRPDVSVIQKGFRLFCAQERQRQQGAHTLHEIPSREWSHRGTSNSSNNSSDLGERS